MGAGGVGGFLGVLLARAGHDVTFVARGAHLEAIRRQGGLKLGTVDGDAFGPAKGVDRPETGRPADLVVFTVKSYDTDEGARLIAPGVGPETALVSFQNGVDNEERLAARYGADRVLGGTAYIFATIDAAGSVRQTGGPRTFTLGEWTGGASARAAWWEAAFSDARIQARASDDIQREKWVKFAFICAQAGMTALTRLPIGVIRGSPPAWEMFRQIVEEVVAVGRARGIGLAPEIVEEHMRRAEALDPGATSSLYHDLTQGKRLEIEALHGTVVRYGREAGVSTPACRAVYAALSVHDHAPS